MNRTTVILQVEWTDTDATGQAQDDPAAWRWATMLDLGPDESVQVLDSNVEGSSTPIPEGLAWFTVFGVHTDSPDNGWSSGDRFAESYLAESAEHAEEQAQNSAGETLLVAAVVAGRINAHA